MKTRITLIIICFRETQESIPYTLVELWVHLAQMLGKVPNFLHNLRLQSASFGHTKMNLCQAVYLYKLCQAYIFISMQHVIDI